MRSVFDHQNPSGLVDLNLKQDYSIINKMVEFLPETRRVSYYIGEVVNVSRNMVLLKELATGVQGNALLSLYRNQQNDQTLTERDLLLALEAETPLEFWKAQDESRAGYTIQEYNAFFTGPQGDSAYTVWKNAQAEGVPTTQTDYFAAIKGEPGTDAHVDLSPYATTSALAAALIPYATNTALETGLAGKVTKSDYGTDKLALQAEYTRIDGKFDMNIEKLGQLADSIEALQEFPHLSQSQINLNAAAREANRVQGSTNALDLIAERNARIAADNNLTTLISTAQNTANRKRDEAQVNEQADARIVEQLMPEGSIGAYIAEQINNIEPGGGTEGALVLEDFALEGARLCGISGLDRGADAYRIAGLNLECDGETTREGVAILGGNIRFTTNSAWNGKFRITDNASLDIIDTATHISGGDGVEQVWRIDGVEWDFTNTRRRSILLDPRDGAVFTPAVDDLTFTFDGELTGAGQAVNSVKAIAKTVAPNLTPSAVQTHSATIAQQHPMTAFTVNTGNNPLSTDVFTVTTKDAGNTALSAINDGELVKFEVPFYFDTQTHEGFPPECSLVIKADGIVIKTYNYDNNNLLSPDQLNLLTFYAGKGETLTFEPAVATSRFGDGSIAITVYPYFDLIQVTQLGILYNASKALAESVVAVQAAKQRLVDNAQDAQIGILGGGVQALRDEYEASVARLEALEARLANPGYAVLDRATVSEPKSTTTTSTTRSALGDEWSAKLETGASPYLAPILFDLTTGGVSPSNVNTLDFLYVRDNAVYANVLTPFQAAIPAHDLPGTVTRNGNVVSADNPIQISLGQDGHHRQTSLTLTPDPNNLPADGAEFHVDFHAVVGGNNRALYESNIVWGNGVPVQKEATNENGESVIVNSFQQGNQVIVQINETGAESLPIAGGYLSLYAHYDYTVPLVPAVNAFSTEVKVGDQVDGHFVVLLETGAGAVSQGRPLIIHYGNGQSIATNRVAAYINFYTNNDANVGNIYSTPYREDRTWDLTQLQANAEAGQADLGFFTETVTNHSTSKLTLDTGLEIINEAEEIVDVAKEIADLKKNAGSSVPTGEFGDRIERTFPSFEVDLAGIINAAPISVPHALLHECFVDAISITALSDISQTSSIGIGVLIDGNQIQFIGGNIYASSDAFNKTDDKVHGYYEPQRSGGGLIDSNTDIQVRLEHDVASSGVPSATGRVRLILYCWRPTG